MQAIPLLSTFRSATDSVHRVVAWNSSTNTVTFSPALPTSGNLANGAAVTFISPGVLVNRGDGATGVDVYTVNSTRVNIAGTFTWNAWAEQLVLASSCPTVSTSNTLAALILAATSTVTINGVRSGWGTGSNSICPSPALVSNIQGDSSSGNPFVANFSGTLLTINNATIQGASAIAFQNSATTTLNNATFINTNGSDAATGEIISLRATFNRAAFIGYRYSNNSNTANQTLSNILLDGASAFLVGNEQWIFTFIDYRSLNMSAEFLMRNFQTLGRNYVLVTNNARGSGLLVIQRGDTASDQGGFILVDKQVSHYFRNISNSPINAAKVQCRDTLNGQHINWPPRFSSVSSVQITDGNRWDGSTQKSYLWTSDASGATITQSVVLAYFASPNTRSINILAFANGTSSGTSLKVKADTGSAQFASAALGPQVNGSFLYKGTRHLITAVANPTTDCSLTISPALSSNTSNNETISIQNNFFDIRNGATIAGFIKNAITIATPSTSTSLVVYDNNAGTFTNTLRLGFVNGAFASASTSINIDNGSGLFSSGDPILYSSFRIGSTNYRIISITRNAADYTIGIYPQLASSVADNTAITISKAPQINETLVHNNNTYLITDVTQAIVNNAVEYTVTIAPPLQSNATANDPVVIQNIQGDDRFNFYTSSYLHLPQQQELTLTGNGTLTNNWQLLNDASITQTTKATVDLYGTTGNPKITTAEQFYDRAKSWWYDNFENLPTSRQGAVLVTRSGTLLNAGALNITLNDNVSDVNVGTNIITNGFGFNTSTNTITVRTATFADTLTTTGTITLSQTGTYSAGIVPATGNVAIAAAGTYDLSGWTFTSGATISNTSGGVVTVWLAPSQVANVTGSGSPAPTIIAKPQLLTAPNFANDTRAYAARVQSFTIASTDINTSTDTITLGNDSQGRPAAFATAAPWTQVRFSLNSGATLPTTTGSVLKDGGFYYWSGGRLYTSIANIPVPPNTIGTPVDFTSQGTGSFTLLAETELFNTVVSGGAGLSQSLVQSNGIAIRLKATYWAESSGTATASVFYDSRDSLLTWSDTAGLAVGATIGPTAPESVHEAIVAASEIQSNKYGLLTPANTGSGLSQFTIALEGVGTLQINSNDTDGVELIQNIFLWWCWVRSTEAGIRLASFDTLEALSFTSYQAGRVEVENTNSTTPLSIAGGSITFPGTSTGIAASSYAINLNADVFGTGATTGLTSPEIRQAVGLASANLDSQLGAINSKTANLPALPAAVSDIPTTSQIWTHATRALTDKDNFNLASSQSFSTTGSVGSVTGAVNSVSNAVTVGAINNNAITANAIATDAITAAKIADNAIDAGSIASGAITNAKFAAGAINATVVADNTITDTKIASNAVTAAKIASGAITNTKFAAGAIDATAVADNAITAAKIATAGLATQASLDTKASQASVDAKASQASVDTLNAKADDITALVL